MRDLLTIAAQYQEGAEIGITLHNNDLCGHIQRPFEGLNRRQRRDQTGSGNVNPIFFGRMESITKQEKWKEKKG